MPDFWTKMREWWDPSLICERLPCNFVPYVLQGFRWPGKFRSVADKVEKLQVRCDRCGKVDETVEEVDLCRIGISSLSMPSEDWRKLRKFGWVNSACPRRATQQEITLAEKR